MQAFLHRIKAIYLELKLFYLELNLSEGFSIWNWIYASIFKVFYLELRLSKAICLELKLFCMQTILSKALLAWNRAPYFKMKLCMTLFLLSFVKLAVSRPADKKTNLPICLKRPTSLHSRSLKLFQASEFYRGQDGPPPSVIDDTRYHIGNASHSRFQPVYWLSCNAINLFENSNSKPS